MFFYILNTTYFLLVSGKWWNGIHAGLKILWPQGYVGSIPTLPIYGPIAQLVRASRRHRGGQRFESSWVHHFNKGMIMKKFLILVFLLIPTIVFAETIVLKSGRVVEGELIEKTDEYVKVDTGEKVLKIRLNLMDDVTKNYIRNSINKVRLDAPKESDTVLMNQPEEASDVIKEREEELTKESKAYINKIIPIIFSSWKAEELISRASPEFVKHIKRDELNKMFEMFREKLGSMTHYKGVVGKANIKIFPQGELSTADYVAYVAYKKEDANIEVQLLLRDKKWEIISFRVNFEVLMPF